MDPGILSAVTIAAGCAIAGLAHVLIRWLKKKAAATRTPLDDIFLEAIGTPLIVAVIATAAYIAVTRFPVIPESLSPVITGQVLNAAFILVAAWILSAFSYRFIHGYGRVLHEREAANHDDRLIPVLEIAARYLIWFVALLFILSHFRIDITPLLAGAGIGALALALAAQDVIGNLYGGIIISVDRPFRVGDRVNVDTFTGDVMNIGLRSTRLRTLDNQIVTIPNSRITTNSVVNFAMPDPKLKVRIPFSVAYGSDLDRAKLVLEEIGREAAEKTTWVLTDPAPLVYLLEFGESGISGQLLIWTDNYDFSWDVQDWVIRRIPQRFAEEKIEIPYSQVDVRIRSAGEGS